LRQIFGLFIQTGRSKTPAVSAIPSWTSAATSWNLSGLNRCHRTPRERAELEKAFEEIKRLRDQLHNENVVLREQIDQAFMFEEIVGTSSALQGVLSRLMKVAPTDSSVLVSGETGTGKELVPAPSISDLVVATRLRERELRSSCPIADFFRTLWPRKGAFTGRCSAARSFELANGGTFSSTKSASCRWTLRLHS